MGPVPFDELTRLGPGEHRAAPGMFRVVVFFGDQRYRLGEDHASLEDAVTAALGQHMEVQVYDDRGEPRLSAGESR